MLQQNPTPAFDREYENRIDLHRGGEHLKPYAEAASVREVNELTQRAMGLSAQNTDPILHESLADSAVRGVHEMYDDKSKKIGAITRTGTVLSVVRKQKIDTSE